MRPKQSLDLGKLSTSQRKGIITGITQFYNWPVSNVSNRQRKTVILTARGIERYIYRFSAMLVIFGVEHNIITDGVMDLVVLLAKAYIYRSKTIQTVPTLSSFKYILYSRYLIEKKHVCYQKSR